MQEQTESPIIETSENKIPAQLRGLFCEPSLLEGEDPNLYWGLLAAVIDERKPVTPADWIAVNDLVTKLWDERVLKRASNALIRGGTLEALQHFFAELIKGEQHLKRMAPPTGLPSISAKSRRKERRSGHCWRSMEPRKRSFTPRRPSEIAMRCRCSSA